MDVENTDWEQVEGAAVPEKWRFELLKLWRGARAVIVQHVQNPDRSGSTVRKIQRIKLQTSARQETPKDDVDDVIEIIAQSVQGWMQDQLEKGKIEENDTCHFRVEVQRAVSKDGTIQRPAFKIQHNLVEALDDNLEYDHFDESQMQAQIMFDRLQRENDSKMVHQENVNEQLLKMAAIQVAPVQEAAELLKMAGQMAQAAMNQMQTNLQEKFSKDKAEAEAREKTKRTEIWMERIGEKVLPLLPAAGAILAAKFAGKDVSGMGSQAMEDLAGASEEQEPQGPPTQWAEMLHALRNSLSDEQWNGIIDTLSREEYKHLMLLLNSQTDYDVFERYQALIEAADLETMLKDLPALFNDEQRAAIMQLHMAHAQAVSQDE